MCILSRIYKRGFESLKARHSVTENDFKIFHEEGDKLKSNWTWSEMK